MHNEASDQDINVFIDFKIVKDSDKEELCEDFDLIISKGRRIYVWSKEVSPQDMKKYCESIKINVKSQKEIQLHKKCLELKQERVKVSREIEDEDGTSKEVTLYKNRTYKDIADELGIDVKKVGYFVRTDPDREWVLDDWIVGYYPKDSSTYQKADIVIDPNGVLVEKFRRSGRLANKVEAIGKEKNNG